MKTQTDLRKRISRAANELKSLIRRKIITATAEGFQWTLEGYEGEAAEPAEVFSGIGFYSRPADGDNPEAVVVTLGSRHKLIIATRNEDQRPTLEADESAIHNSAAIVHVTKSGEVHAKSRSGTAVALATKADIDALQAAIDSHIHTTTATVGATAAIGAISPPSTGVFPVVLVPMPTAAGTSKLKGE